MSQNAVDTPPQLTSPVTQEKVIRKSQVKSPKVAKTSGQQVRSFQETSKKSKTVSALSTPASMRSKVSSVDTTTSRKTKTIVKSKQAIDNGKLKEKSTPKGSKDEKTTKDAAGREHVAKSSSPIPVPVQKLPSVMSSVKKDDHKIAVREIVQAIIDGENKSVKEHFKSVERERLDALKEIVIQNGMDRKIFCIFDQHRYIAGPIREELLTRGWLEFVPDRRLIPRRKQGTPIPAPEKKINRTFDAIWRNEESNESIPIFKVEPPSTDSSSGFVTNTKIRDFMAEQAEKRSKSPSGATSRRSSRSKKSLLILPEESKVISQLIQSENYQVNFVWLSSKPDLQLQFFPYAPSVCSKFQKTVFCSKIGLWYNMRFLDEFKHQFRYPVQTPRMYNIADNESRQAFLMDFRMTAAISILRWLIETVERWGVKGVRDAHGQVPIRAFEFALRKCDKFVKFKQRNDHQLWEDIKGSETQWNHFLSWFYAVTNDNVRLKQNLSAKLILGLKARAMTAITDMLPHWPALYNDGRLNIWIMKPYSASCGRGIYITNNINYIEQQQRFIAQKYIEKPMLIQDTKFDIRQWFMITNLKPLKVWMYTECYLRFCSQPFDLYNLHESVHLSNNAIQRKYTNAVHLRGQNMWDSKTFIQYLIEAGHPDLWKKRIYPGMRDGIVSALLCCQHTFDKERDGWFEVYGADFMLSANLKEGPWLIEMNEGPALDPSTPVTARLCPQMLRDVIKVVVDYKKRPKCDTGGWELVYCQPSD